MLKDAPDDQKILEIPMLELNRFFVQKFEGITEE